MILKHKNRYKPLYKQFIKLKENIQNRKKVLNFRKHKWQLFIKNYKQKLKYYRKFKPNDPVQYLVSKYPTKNLSYRNRYKTTLGDSKKLRLVYGGLSKKKVKKLLKILTKKTYKEVNLLFLKLLDYRLDVVLYKAKFATSIRNAQQFIMHNKILVNKKIIKIKSYFIIYLFVIIHNVFYGHRVRSKFLNYDKQTVPLLE